MNNYELRKLAAEATPGPWIAAGPSFGAALPVYCEEVIVAREGDEDDGYGICQAPTGLEKESTRDMVFIAAANPAKIIELLDTIEQQRKLLELAEKDAARFRWLCENDLSSKFYDCDFGAPLREHWLISGDSLAATIDYYLRQQEGEKK